MNHHHRTTHLLPDLVTDELLRGSLALSARPDAPVQPSPATPASRRRVALSWAPRLAALRTARRRSAGPPSAVGGRPADVCVGTRITSA